MKPTVKHMALAVIFLILFPLAAQAHRVIVFAWVEEGQIHVKGSFGKDRPAMNSKIELVTPEEVVLAQTTTDKKGMAVFALPQSIDSDLTVQLEAGPGHQGHWTLSQDELLAGLPAKTPSQTPEQTSAAPEKETRVDTSHEQEIEDLEAGPSPYRIAGGIGLIFVLAFGVQTLKRRKAGA